jgi:hypothetical protein
VLLHLFLAHIATLSINDLWVFKRKSFHCTDPQGRKIPFIIFMFILEETRETNRGLEKIAEEELLDL